MTTTSASQPSPASQLLNIAEQIACASYMTAGSPDHVQLLEAIALMKGDLVTSARSDKDAERSSVRFQAYELDGVIADVEQGGGFDSICLDTIKRVRAVLAANGHFSEAQESAPNGDDDEIRAAYEARYLGGGPGYSMYRRGWEDSASSSTAGSTAAPRLSCTYCHSTKQAGWEKCGECGKSEFKPWAEIVAGFGKRAPTVTASAPIIDFGKLQAIADRVDARGLFNASGDIREWIEAARATAGNATLTDLNDSGIHPGKPTGGVLVSNADTVKLFRSRGNKQWHAAPEKRIARIETEPDIYEVRTFYAAPAGGQEAILDQKSWGRDASEGFHRSDLDDFLSGQSNDDLKPGDTIYCGRSTLDGTVVDITPYVLKACDFDADDERYGRADPFMALPDTRPLHANERAFDEPVDEHDRYIYRIGFNACRNSLAKTMINVAAQPQPAGMPVEQEPKYGIRENRLYNRASGEFIPTDEPVFIFRARDVHAAKAIAWYSSLFPSGHHWSAVAYRVEDFEAFARSQPGRMKEPDTAINQPIPSGEK
jgi:hypothetical protein